MPNLSRECLADIHRYVNLRFDHFTNAEKLERKAKIAEALEKEPVERHEQYSREVQALYDKNKDFLASCAESVIKAGPKEMVKSIRKVIHGNHH